MDLSTPDVLLGLAAIAVFTAAGIAVCFRKSPEPWQSERLPKPAETGRHHVPNGLLDNPTTRLDPEVLARAKKPQT
ncbi:MAG: hypothetical protein QOE51_4217 [Actinoplanes sp.]|jgi:hypothetical protein|nr:hypothetical protein [Actinoplanes sp.]